MKEKKVSNVKKRILKEKPIEKYLKKMSLEIPNRLTNMLKKVAQDAMRKAVRECSREYNFSEEEALIKLKIEDLRIREKGKKEKKEKKEKSKIPLPYNNEYSEECCNALRLNQGLYTQCENMKEECKLYCKGCAKKTEGEMPEYGTIFMRRETGIMVYVDPKGRKPTPNVKIMKKLNLTREQVIEEAERLNKTINECHFEEVEHKRGRPAAIKEKVAKGMKGRPKKTKKVVEIRGENDTVDIFASLVANAEKEELPALSNDSQEIDEQIANIVSDVSEAEKTEEVEEVVEEKVVEEEKRKEKEEKRKEKEQREKEREEKRKEKEQKEKEREEKRKEKEQREKEREEKRKEKEQREKEREEKRKEKELKEAGKNKAEVPAEVKKAEVPAEEEEEEKFKKIIYNGTKYLVSRRTSIAYDYDKFANGEHVVVGKYNEKTKIIEKDDEEEVSSDEESEDEYDE
jgi:hypothetical protein